MQSEPNEYKVMDLQLAGCLLVEDGNHGEYRPRPDEFGSGNTAFIRAADMEGGRILFESAGKINDVALARISKGIGRGGDILFSHKGTVGKLAVAPLDAPPFVCSPQTTFWRTLDEERLDRRYLYYFMCSRRFWEQWHSRKGETDMADYVSLTAQRELFVVVPHIDKQRSIARILVALDNKIELNRQMNRTLEAMAQALFKSWFVDFDPVTAKAEGRRPYGMDEEMAALFPDAFEDSESGDIPKGWHVEKVGDCVVRHSVGKKYDQFTVSDKGKVPVLDQGRSGLIGFHNDEPGITASLENPIIVFANHTCYMRLITIPFSAIQNVLPFTGRDLNIFWLFYATNGIQEFLEYKGHWPDFVIKKIAVPPKTLTERFGDRVKSWVALIHNNEEQSQTLTALRDALLPKLLSGEIRVRQAEKLVAEAV